MKGIGISYGVLVLPPEQELFLHHHSPQKIYIIRSDEGFLLSSTTKKVCQDCFIYIPKNFEHGLKNRGKEDLEVLGIFPTDCWEEVEYIFEK